MEDYKKYAFERANQDYIASNSYARAAAQASILINGGAATAILALARNIEVKSLYRFSPYALAGYAVGVILGTWMMFLLISQAELWAEWWQGEARGSKNSQSPAGRAYWWAKTCFGGSIMCFVLSSMAAALDLLK